MKYFVMLRSQTGEFPLPLVDLEDDPVLFDSEVEAHKAASRTMLGDAFGYRVYPWNSISAPSS
jgi:hypothetical protein